MGFAAGGLTARCFAGLGGGLFSLFGFAARGSLPLCGLAVPVQQGRNFLDIFAGLALSEQVVDVDAGSIFFRQHKIFRSMQMQQLRADQTRNRPIVVIGGLFVKLRNLDRTSIFFSHGQPFILKNTQSLSARIWSPSRSRKVSACCSRTVPLSLPARNILVTVAGIEACSKIR